MEMLSRILSRPNNGSVNPGAIDHVLLLLLNRFPEAELCRPTVAARLKRGYKSAVATPISALARATSCSARRISGRRNSNSDGKPAATDALDTGIAVGCS